MILDQQATDYRRLVLRRSATALPGYFGNAMTTSLMAVLFARWMGVDDLGAYAFAFHVVRIVVLLAGFGLNAGAVRLIPRYQKADRHGEITGFLIGASLFTAVACALIGALVFVFSLPAIEGSSSHSALWHADWLAASLGVGILLAGVLRAHGHTLTAAIAQNSGRNIAAMLIALAMFDAQGSINAEDGLVALALAVLLGLIVQISMLLWHHRIPFVRPVFRPGEWLSTSTPMIAGALTRTILAGGDVIIIRLVLGEGDAGLYHAAITLALTAHLIGLAVFAAASPELARHDGTDAPATWQSIYHYSLKLSVSGGIAIAILLIVFGKSLLGLFGDGFEAAYPVLVVLTFGVVCQNLSFGAIISLNMSGGAKRGVPWLVMLAAISLSLSILGTLSFGMVGTAAAFGLSRILVTLTMMHQVRRHRKDQLALSATSQ